MFGRRALVRRPSPRLPEGLVTHVSRTPVDVVRAADQWDGYVAALRDEGWETIEVPPADDCPDSVFVEDTVVMYADTAVITRPGAPERRREVDGTRDTVTVLGYHVAEITAGDNESATLDGGDVLKHDGTVWVGSSGRSSEAGIAQLAEHLDRHGARVVPVPTSRVLHLKSAVTALPDGTVIGFRPLVDRSTVWRRFLPMPEETGAHVVVLDERTVLMSASAPASRRLLEHRGLRVVPVEIDEFEKLEGCVTCLSVRLRHTP